MATANRRVVSENSPLVETANKLGQNLPLGPNIAPYYKKRLELFEKLFNAQQTFIENSLHDAITITFPDGSTKQGQRFKTTPLELAREISEGLANQSVVAKVWCTGKERPDANLATNIEDDKEMDRCCGSDPKKTHILWDMTRPLEADCSLEFLKFDCEEGQTVFWHSSAHVLGEAIEREFGAYLTIGPPLERGFYYDAYMGEELRINQDMYPKIEEHVQRIIKENQCFQRLVLTKEQALEMFKDNPFKYSIIANKVPDGAQTVCYRCGDLIDLCRGPHLASSAKVKAFSIEKHSASYWLGNANNDSLQRIYAISFPSSSQMKEYKAMVAEAKKRDHRVVGNNLDLFFFESNLSPGSCFWLPDGAKIYNRLTEFMRNEYRIRGFREVLSPNIYSCELFKASGHYQNYKENMYCFDVEGKEWAMKPMNCPGHCLIFRHMNPSYKQLPIRMADFGVLHRNEASGSLSGLIRVRRFQQDDAHIFCAMDQIKKEVAGALDFLFFIYGAFGFKFDLMLSTRPEKAMGEIDLWNQAEAALAEALNETGKPWILNPGDGAFYGPKIDMRLEDALKRWHQCGTIQLDFQLPLRFNLQYKTADEVSVIQTDDLSSLSSGELPQKRVDGSWETKLKPGYARPVIVHRAILGSIERMTAVLVEHTGGKFPFWLSPRQILVCPISVGRNIDYARYVADIFNSHGFEVGVDDSNNTINKKIRQAQLEMWNYIFVVGTQEQENGTITLRNRDDPTHQQQVSITEALKIMKSHTIPSSRPLADEIQPFKST